MDSNNYMIQTHAATHINETTTMDVDDAEPPYKRLKLSLERPYKDDNGEPIPVLHNITLEGVHEYEPREDLTAKVGENLRRIFFERGHDFFDKMDRGEHAEKEDAEEDKEENARDTTQPMTPEELFKMRTELMPHLHVAIGEMTQARDLLASLLSTGPSSQPLIPGLSQLTQPSLSQSQSQSQSQPQLLRATTVTKEAPILPVQAFNTQLVIGGKDKALRKAAELLKTASDGVEQGRARSERYWVDALRIRKTNWGLVPAPLPPGSATGKGADRTTKDFLVAFGLEESPPVFRRRAIGRMPAFDTTTGALEYPLRQFTHLQVSLITEQPDGTKRVAQNRCRVTDEESLETSLKAAQAEVVQQEIFSVLIKEASNLSTASARVSERLIALEAAQGVELRFELVDNDVALSSDAESDPTCDLIFSALHVLLLRAHAHLKAARLERASGFLPPLASSLSSSQPSTHRTDPSPLVLQPIVDVLQYRVFCARVNGEIRKMVDSLRRAGVRVFMRLNTAGDSAERVMGALAGASAGADVGVGGEALVRIDDRRTLRFTFLSPSSLVAHLPQATLPLGSMSQLSQLLCDEAGSCLLERIKEVAAARCEGVVAGTWFVDPLASRTVGRWEGHALNFHVAFSSDSSIVCTATRLERGTSRHPVTHVEAYTPPHSPDAGSEGAMLLDWVQRTVGKALAQPSGA